MLDVSQEGVGYALRPSSEDEGATTRRPRKKPGRPQKKRKRDRALNIKCYSEEKDFLERLAAAHGVSISQVCRAIWGTVANDERLVNIVRARLARVF